MKSALLELCKKPGHKSLKEWVNPLITHFWWCTDHCKKSADRLCDLWLRMLHHVCGQHDWIIAKCKHHSPGEDVPKDGKTYMNPKSKAFESLRTYATSDKLLDSFGYYTLQRDTSKIENFNSHGLLRYVPKRLKFSYDIYVMRCQLAVLDYNFHLERDYQVNQTTGLPILTSHVSRRTSEWVAYRVLSKKDYSYIPDLMAECLHYRYGGVISKKSATSDELDELYPNKSGSANPGAMKIYLNQKERGS